MHLLSGGPSLTLGLPIGELALAGALSMDGRGGGGAASLTYTYNARRLSFGLLARVLTSGYSTVSLASTDDRSLLEVGGSVGMPLGGRVSLSAQASGIETRDHGDSHRFSLTSSIGISRQLQLTLSATESGGGGEADGVSGFIGFSLPIGERTTFAVSQQVGGPGTETTLDLQQTLPAASGYGYRLQGQVGAQQTDDALVEAQSDTGHYTAEVSWDGTRAASVLGVAGGLVLIGGRLLATRPVQEGFALIRVPGVAGVRGYVDNQEIGRTDSDGDLVVPNLLPYYANRISISDVDLPLDYSAPALEQLIAPTDRGGVVVSFAARRMSLVRGYIVIDSGGQSPAYGEMHVDAGGGRDAVSPVGHDGRFEIEDLTPGPHLAEVEYRGGSCKTSLQVPGGNQPILDLGRLPCVVSQEATR